MTSFFDMVLLQTFYYGAVAVLTLFFCGAFMRGFFVDYFKVRTSFGKLVMVKIRTPLRDYFAKGEVKEGFLIYKLKTGFRKYDVIRLNIPKDVNPFYKCMSVNWVDVDDEKNAITNTQYSTVKGFDAVKHNNLLTRALMKPQIASGQEKIMLFLIVVTLILSLASAYLAYSGYAGVQTLQQNLPGMIKNLAGTVTGGGVI